MNVGIPGTGLGGLFYGLSIVGMLVIEVYRLLIGKSDPDRRWLAFRQSAMLVGVVFTLVLMDLFFEKILFAPGSQLAVFVSEKAAVSGDAVALSTTLLGIGTLIVLTFLVHVLRFFFAEKVQASPVPE